MVSPIEVTLRSLEGKPLVALPLRVCFVLSSAEGNEAAVFVSFGHSVVGWIRLQGTSALWNGATELAEVSALCPTFASIGKRRRTAALQDASRRTRRVVPPRGFGLRQCSAALKHSGAAAHALHDASRRTRRVVPPPGLGLRQCSAALKPAENRRTPGRFAMPPHASELRRFWSAPVPRRSWGDELRRVRHLTTKATKATQSGATGFRRNVRRLRCPLFKSAPTGSVCSRPLPGSRSSVRGPPPSLTLRVFAGTVPTVNAGEIIREIEALPRDEQVQVIRFVYRLDAERQLSGGELASLAERLAATDDPADALLLREAIVRGFYGA